MHFLFCVFMPLGCDVFTTRCSLFVGFVGCVPSIVCFEKKNRPDPQSQFRLAIGSYVEKYCNAVEIVKKRLPIAASMGKSTIDYTGAGAMARSSSHTHRQDVEEDDMNQQLQQHLHHSQPQQQQQHLGSVDEEFDEDDPNHPSFYDSTLFRATDFDHPYPCTKIMWSPDVSFGGKDLLATTGDYLRVWELVDDESGRGTLIPKKEALLNNVSFWQFACVWYVCFVCITDTQVVRNSNLLHKAFTDNSMLFYTARGLRTRRVNTVLLSLPLTGMRRTQTLSGHRPLTLRVRFGMSPNKRLEHN